MSVISIEEQLANMLNRIAATEKQLDIHEKRLTAIEQPTLMKSSDADSATMNMWWLSDHQREYVGKWVAVQNGMLLASANTRKELVQNANVPSTTNVLITHVTKESVDK